MSGLTAEEAERASRLIQPEKRNLLAANLKERRELLARLLGCGIEEASILHDSEGKPELPGSPGTELSLSDSHGWNALALCRFGPVGIDLEPVRDIAWEAMLAMMSEPDEADEITLAVRASNSLIPFFRCWTAKEAVLKATGMGMRGGPKRIVVPADLIRSETDVIPVNHEGTGFSLEMTAIGDVIVARAMQA